MKNWLLLNKLILIKCRACLITGFAFSLFIQLSAQQNLIPNSSFEYHFSSCPNVDVRVTTSIPWFQPNTFNGNVINSCSTDYYHKCSNFGSNGIPNSTHGYQPPHTDSAYVGFAIYGSNYREYLEVVSIDSLKKNKSYCLSFFTKISRMSKYGTNGLSAVFSIDSILNTNSSSPPLNFTPQIDFNGTYIQDTLSWIKLEGSFVANDNYNFVTIGNFRNDAQTGSVLTGFGSYNGTYIFIDDVELKEIFDAKTVNDTLINNPASLQLGDNTDTTAFYEWWPSIGIADTNAMNPIATVNQTTMYYVQKTQCGEVSIDSVLITVSPIGFNDINLSQQDYSLFPNPNNGSFTLQSLSDNPFSGSMKVFDICGKLIYDENIGFKNSINIDLEKELLKGVYFLKLYDKNKSLVFVYKIIVQ